MELVMPSPSGLSIRAGLDLRYLQLMQSCCLTPGLGRYKVWGLIESKVLSLLLGMA